MLGGDPVQFKEGGREVQGIPEGDDGIKPRVSEASPGIGNS